MRVHRAILAGLLALTLSLLAGCGAHPPSPGAAQPAPGPRDPTKVAAAPPPWLATAPKDLGDIYAWAAAHHEELQYIPCYCGCASMGHTSNSSCYFQRDAEGRILAYEQHAFT